MRQLPVTAAIFALAITATLADPPSSWPVELISIISGEWIAQRDKNDDGKLNADEVPDRLRPFFSQADINHDGYLNAQELTQVLTSRPQNPQGQVIAQYLITVADDFIIEVYHNGVRVPDDRRELLLEQFGATAEKIQVEVREGDWLVFNVVNNRLRWGGAAYFAVAGMKDSSPRIGFTTELTSGKWSCCDDPSRVSRFLSDPNYLRTQPARSIPTLWGGGDPLMNQLVDGWTGTPLWGTTRNTWIKFVAR
jgi:hypothetical protein